MSRRLVFVFAAGLALGGCCFGGGCYIQPPTGALASWDGLGPMPRPYHAKAVKVKARTTDVAMASEPGSPSEADLEKLKPYSREWTVMLAAINRAADDELKKKLIICRDCLPSGTDDHTSSVAAGGYVPVRQ
jgi:hypothetical protein